MQVVSMTNRGMERPRNEDSCLAKVDSNLALLVVADGMGGHRAGNVASGLAVSTAERLWNDFDWSATLSPEDTRIIISRLILEANKLILDEADNSSARRGMGTTLTAGLLCGKRLTIGHIGDSRAYLVYNGRIELLTTDHSLLEQLIASGQVKPEEAHDHPQRHVLTRALGTTSDPEIDITEFDLEAGSALLFCTDGLTNLVKDNEILALCQNESDPHDLARALIDFANSRGGHDNITVVIATGIGGQGA